MEEKIISINSKHKQLYKLKYLEHVADSFVLSQQLKLPLGQIALLSEELDAYLVGKLGRIEPDRLEFMCPECFQARLIADLEKGETVCTNPDCGYVLPQEVADQDDSLPFDVTYAPTSALSIQHSLGSSMTYREQSKMQRENGDNFQTLKSFLETHPSLAGKLKDGAIVYDDKYAYLLDEAGAKVYMANLKDVSTFVLNKNLLNRQDRAKLFHMNDMPLRVRRIRLITSAEHPELDKLLKEAYELSKFYNLDGNYTFNNNLGANVRRAFWLTHELKIKVPKLNLAETVFYSTLNQGDKNKLSGQTVIAALKAQNTFDRTGFLYSLLVKFNAFLDETKKAAAIDERTDEDATELYELLT